MKYPTKRMVLPKALSVYAKGGLSGRRKIEDGEDIPYTMTWIVSNLPGDFTRCVMIFEDNADLTYEVGLISSDLIGYLIDWLINVRDTAVPDFSAQFYRKLMKMDS